MPLLWAPWYGYQPTPEALVQLGHSYSIWIMLTRPQLVNVGGVIAISLAVTHGLGRRESKLTEAQVSRAGQVRYAGYV